MKKRNVFLIAVVVLVLGVLVNVLLSYRYFFTPYNASSKKEVTFIIPKGQAISVIGERLAEEDLIRHPLVFRLAVKITGVAADIQAGSFQISPAMTPAEIAQKLTEGTEDTWLTILEGWRAEQIAQTAEELELPLFDADEFLRIVELQDSEGKLFPDSYLIPKQYDAEQLHDLLVTTFEQKVLDGLENEIALSSRSFNEVLIMASLVEREARGYEQMRKVAGVLWNRIEIGMALQVDATLQYITGYNENTQEWWSTPLSRHKEIASPYNTYQNPGLPPAPIANPGLDAIRATLNPSPSNNLFYLHDTSGTIYFAETLDQHNANIDRYLR